MLLLHAGFPQQSVKEGSVPALQEVSFSARQSASGSVPRGGGGWESIVGQVHFSWTFARQTWKLGGHQAFRHKQLELY